MSENSNKKNEVCDLLQSVSENSIKRACNEFYFDINNNCWFDQSQVGKSLHPLLGKSPNKPRILISDTINFSDALKDLKGMVSRDCCNKSTICIHNSGSHFTVFYHFQKEKKILFIDPMGATGKPDLKNEGYTLYVSNTKIQRDGYSCGPIASEIARMLYSNYEAVESHLSKLGSNRDSVSLDDFLPREELDQLRKSFSEEITIDYGENKIRLKGADYRTAHLVCNLTKDIHYAIITPGLVRSGYHDVEEIPQEEKQKVEKIRALFIGNPDNVKLFNQEVNKLLRQNKVVDSDNVTSKSSQRSKRPVIAASMLSITGVATGIAIAVYLEMLAVGIAVGACCLVAAAIIYFCSGPSNSLEKSSAKAATNKCCLEAPN
ncbi:TomO hydrophobic C-terminal domain-containing protein [Wolbachia endosymbiont of Oedothorax gibbosus]|uniref:TomO hydrophobic C-terminal domain-containing protein n=1 Tax=Wolbachia endosymbiont of Oedothorax gibbosus TaxID=931100 RepID=UPI0020251EBA|nr:hypothetical protein [Wolbachia endosymbiont of Oedothorax gibbosus]